VRSAECGVRSAECGVRSAECGVRKGEVECPAARGAGHFRVRGRAQRLVSCRPPPERMNLPLGKRKVRLRGLDGRSRVPASTRRRIRNRESAADTLSRSDVILRERWQAPSARATVCRDRRICTLVTRDVRTQHTGPRALMPQAQRAHPADSSVGAPGIHPAWQLRACAFRRMTGIRKTRKVRRARCKRFVSPPRPPYVPTYLVA
jgi:hypothetical protein